VLPSAAGFARTRRAAQRAAVLLPLAAQHAAAAQYPLGDRQKVAHAFGL
jgi:hypothetical protein